MLFGGFAWNYKFMGVYRKNVWVHGDYLYFSLIFKYLTIFKNAKNQKHYIAKILNQNVTKLNENMMKTTKMIKVWTTLKLKSTIKYEKKT